MINELNDILLLMVMEMRMSDWTGLVGGNISVFQISGAKHFILLIFI